MGSDTVLVGAREADAHQAVRDAQADQRDAGRASGPGDRGTGRRPDARPTGRRLGWLGLVLPVALVVAWVLATTVLDAPAYKLPGPGDVWAAAVQLAGTGQLGLYVAISVQRVLLGFAAGAVVGLLLGAVVGLSRVGEALLAPTVAAVRAVPSLAWVPILILYLGVGEDSKVFLIAIGAAFPVFTTVAGSLRHVDPHLVEAGRAYGLGAVELFARVQLPAVLPALVSGLRLALAQAWLFLVAAELIASSMGLGFLLSDSQNNGRVDRMFLAIILLALLGTLTDAVLNLLQRVLLRRWR